MQVRGDAERERLLQAVRAMAERDGRAPGIRRFSQHAGVGKHLFQGVIWATWGDFLAEAGLAAATMTQAHTDDEMLRHLATLTMSAGRFPTFAQLRLAGVQGRGPTEKTYRTRFGGLAGMKAQLRRWIGEHPEYQHLENVLTEEGASQPRRPVRPMPTVASIIGESYVPPVVECLPALARGDEEMELACSERGLTVSVEFERRVGVALGLLGLDVEPLGQGGGRVADGIARSRAGRWALIFDAKVRRSGFLMGTEDRKFRDYLDRHGRDLERDGIDAIYFAVVSSTFAERDLESAAELVRLTRAKAFVLLEAEALVALVDRRLRTRDLDDPDNLERLFARSAIVTRQLVEAIPAVR